MVSIKLGFHPWETHSSVDEIPYVHTAKSSRVGSIPVASKLGV